MTQYKNKSLTKNKINGFPVRIPFFKMSSRLRREVILLSSKRNISVGDAFIDIAMASIKG